MNEMGIQRQNPQSGSLQFSHCFQVKLELGDVGFCEGKKIGEQPLEQG